MLDTIQIVEFNKMLSMIRDTIEKEFHRRKLIRELQGYNELLVKNLYNLQSLEIALKRFYSNENVKYELKKITKQKQEENVQINWFIESYKKKIKDINNKLESEKNFYKDTIEGFLHKNSEGLIPLNQVKDEYLKEYIYLALVSEIGITDIFCGNSKKLSNNQFLDEFFGLLVKKLSYEKAVLILSIFEGNQGIQFFLNNYE